MNQINATKLRAQVIIKGAKDSFFYGKNPAGVERNAIKALTFWKPGECSLHPERIEIAEQVERWSALHKRVVEWRVVKTIKYDEIPESQHEWRRREEQHARK